MFILDNEVHMQLWNYSYTNYTLQITPKLYKMPDSTIKR